MKIATIEAKITPPVGTLLAGYGSKDVSESIHDDLKVNGLCFDDGEKKALLLSFDLIGLEMSVVSELRRRCAELIGGTEADVMLTCTHTHEGPHTRETGANALDEIACRILVTNTLAAVEAAVQGNFTEVTASFYSEQVDVNTNRRYCGPENVCRFLPHHRSLEPLADGTTDRELGILLFNRAGTSRPFAVIGNYAAHPLVAHAPGAGGLAISADYPGRYRELVEESTGAFPVFTTGAAGDQFPIASELGFSALDLMAGPLARATVHGMIDASRNPAKFRMDDPKIHTSIRRFEAALRADKPDEKRIPKLRGLKNTELEVQLLAVGDVCFVGVPGELEAGPGLEIKWHSPYRRTWVLYNSTGYYGYFSPANDFVSGGYESARGQNFEVLTVLDMVNTAVRGMFELHGAIDIPPWPPAIQNGKGTR